MSLGRVQRLLLILLPALALAFGLAYVIRNSVRDAVILPLTYLLWFGSLLIRSTPQVLFWGLLLTLGLVIAARSLGAPRNPLQRIGELPFRLPRRERLGFWVLQLQMAQWRNSMVRFSDFFGRLIIEVLAFRYHITPAQMERNLADEQGLPAEVWAYLNARRAPLALNNSILKIWVTRFGEIRRAIGQKRFHTQASPVLDNLEQALSFLEAELEIKHER
jgi:hypothetical protein